EPGAVLDRPLQVIHRGGDGSRSVHLRSLVLAGANSRATVVESHLGGGEGWSNCVMQLRLDEAARIHHALLQDESQSAIHVALARAQLARGAEYESFTLNLGARLARHDLLVALAGEGARCALDGAYLLRGQQEATVSTFVDHAAPGCSLREVFKGVVEDRAHGVFLGKIAVRPGADKTDAHQLNRNLLLSPRAAVDTKPELEILADDVKCSHGATVGDLDETALFYLRSRGIDEAAARRMLIEAFAADALDLVAEESVRALLRRHLDTWLEKGGRNA